MRSRISTLFIGLSFVGFTSISAQDELDYTDEDLPEFVEDFGYEDADYSGPSLVTETGRNAAGQNTGCDGRAFSSHSNQNCGSICSRPTLFGDCGGHRTCLQQNGIVYRGRLTQYFLGVEGGINDPVPGPLAQKFSAGDRFDYTGTSQHDFLLDLQKLVGGLPASRLAITFENIWGRYGNVSLSSGGVAPIFGAYMPADLEAEGVPRMTNFFYVQPICENLILGAGKLRLPGTADQDIFAGGDGSDQFLNQALAANPLFLALFPISTFGVSAVMPQEWGNISVSVLDVKERSLDYFEFDDLYSQGAIVSAQLKLKTNLFCKPGEHHVGGVWKSADLPDLRVLGAAPDYPYPPARPGVPAIGEAYAIYYGFDQYLQVFGNQNARGNKAGWGLFGRAGIADGASGNPNFYGWTASVGIGGNSPLQCRRGKGDQFGIGYAYTGTSTEWGPIPTAVLAPRDYQVFETYYRYQITPAISVSPDFQWTRGVLGGLTGGDDAFIAGFRMNINL